MYHNIWVRQIHIEYYWTNRQQRIESGQDQLLFLTKMNYKMKMLHVQS